MSLVKKAFYKRLLVLAVPIALQNLAATSLNLIDTLMIGQLGETSIGAVALGNQVFFLLMLFLFGISSGSAVFTAQFWGKGDIKGIHRSMGLALIPGLTGALLFTLAAQLMPETILSLFTRDRIVVVLGISYLKIISVSYLCTALSIILQGILRSTGEVKLPLKITLLSLSLNALFNYILIFGKFGFPEMGIRGAALATAGARYLEVSLLIIISWKRGYVIACSPRDMLSFSRNFVKKFVSRVWPVVLNEVGWSLGMTIFTFVYARMGTEVLAAFNIMDTVGRLVFVFFVGMANASSIIIGNTLGEGKKEEAGVYARVLLLTALVMGILCGIIVFAAAPIVPLFFKVSPDVKSLIVLFMRLFAFVIFVKISNMQIIVSILRAGGDTVVCMLLEIVPLWGIGIPLALFTGLVLGVHPGLVYLATMSEELLKYILGLFRVKTGKWIQSIV